MIGIDLVFVPEFEQQLKAGGETFMRKAFRVSEPLSDKAEHLAGMWAAKEAVMKAATVQPDKWTDIVISHDSEGRPHAHINERVFEISIAHHGDYAVAVAQEINI
ncbi:MAG TPA: 4'-phosphopantetheinyl transferase superfamily protein [Candidatus Saccharimonadales bacterium]|nr:4'-phosphopantetheinyl transferase superfamily protein [Candidatus Saccharimonadales bacterium]